MRAAARYVGAAIAIACGALVVWRVSQLTAELAPYFRDWGTLVGLAGLAVLYALSLFLLAFAWVTLIPRDGPLPATREVVRVYGVTSIAKYLPGNVLHFAGRQIVGRRLGLSQAAMARATAIESLLSVAMALGVAVLVAVASDAGAMLASRWAFVVLLAAALVAVAFLLASRRVSLGGGAAALDPQVVLLASSCAAAFFAISAVIAVAAGALLLPTAIPSAAIAAAYLLAWTIGYVVPGAPGGVGVREATLLGLLASTASVPSILALALATRLITTLGDVLFAALSAADGVRARRVLAKRGSAIS